MVFPGSGKDEHGATVVADVNEIITGNGGY
jgi:hypothetical protein